MIILKCQGKSRSSFSLSVLIHNNKGVIFQFIATNIEIKMAKNIYRFKGIFKSFLFVFAVVITLGFSIYIYVFVDNLQQQTRSLIKDMQNQSREFLNFRVRIFEESINSESSQDLNFFFDEVIQQADYPIIYTDASMIPQYWRNISIAKSEITATPRSALPFSPSNTSNDCTLPVSRSAAAVMSLNVDPGS